uniref:Ankyrin repeat and SOCS box containing 8 n=1 Tax=Rhinolophus ferrumequinum TaxID=59479 RepID=A0A671EM07_RHIFE
MSSSMWYIMQSIQSKYSLSERLIRTIAAIRSFPHDNVEDLIRGSIMAVELFQLSCLMMRFPLFL